MHSEQLRAGLETLAADEDEEFTPSGLRASPPALKATLPPDEAWLFWVLRTEVGVVAESPP
jgi:hypothetical protein